MSINNFRFNSQTIGLTYSQSKLSVDVLINHFKTIFSDYCIKYIVVSHEKHSDGADHFHGAIKLGRPICTRDSRFWDILNEHPNVLRPRNFKQWVEYVKKDGTYQEEGSLDADSRRTTISSEEIIRNATKLSKVEFLVWASVNKITYAKDIWDLTHQSAGITIKDGDVFNGIMSQSLMTLKFSTDWLGPKALILIGDSGVGKTTWAKTNIPKPCLFVTHIDELRQFKMNYHQSILFDDVSFKHYPIQSQIHLVDFFDSRSIHVRYGIATIPANIYKFFTCNEDPIDLSHPAIKRRCKVVRIIEPDLFSN